MDLDQYLQDIAKNLQGKTFIVTKVFNNKKENRLYLKEIKDGRTNNF